MINQTTSGGASGYALTDASGNSNGTQTYDAFGGSRGQSDSQLPFGHAREQLDAESRLGVINDTGGQRGSRDRGDYLAVNGIDEGERACRRAGRQSLVWLGLVAPR
ncbi:MAG: hypothetical protein ACR2PL_03790 [Dehalococcoidia bacterium]